MKKLILVVALGAGGASPRHLHWTGGDGTRFKMTDWECQRDSQALKSEPVFGSIYDPNLRVNLPTVVGAAPEQRLDLDLYKKCMEAHGYTLVKEE
jgi:hypothetical protein